MPRLKVKPSEQRKNQFNIYFSDDELKIVEAYMEMNGIKVRGRFYRECIMKQIMRELTKERIRKDIQITRSITKPH